jgi:gas vesicle protein
MTARFKSFLIGLVIGALVAFFLGMNVGKGAPLLSNPFAKRDLSATIKDEAGRLAEGAREKIHDATKPEAPKK